MTIDHQQLDSFSIGFVGTGNITSAVVEGLATAETPPQSIHLSPRNARKASKLARGFDMVSVAENNQQVVDRSDIVFIALRPPQVPDVLKKLTFRKDQVVVSLIPTIPLEKMEVLVSPVTRIIRAVPLPPFAKHSGSVIHFPDDPLAGVIFGSVNQTIPVPDEHQLQVLWAATAMISPFYAFLDETASWSKDNGVTPDIADSYIAAMYHALADMGRKYVSLGFKKLALEAATPGGLNEQTLKMMTDAGAYDSVRNALDAAFARFSRNLE